MYVSEDRVQRGKDIPHVGGLSVQRGVIHASVVHAIFFTASDTNFHLEPDPEWRHALEVLGADFDVFMLRLFGREENRASPMGGASWRSGQCAG